MGVQDGEAAGRTVAHVHVHILPRKQGDAGGEASGGSIFRQLQGHEEDRVARSIEDMAQEAAIYREMMKNQ
jgi:diadenosine tetraphosphate (Ap4A) HIT family hydrolase